MEKEFQIIILCGWDESIWDKSTEKLSCTSDLEAMKTIFAIKAY